MKIRVTSHLYERTDLSGEYEVGPSTSIIEFIETVNVSWDVDVLVVVNDLIVAQDYVLQPDDHVYLLTPIVGG